MYSELHRYTVRRKNSVLLDQFNIFNWFNCSTGRPALLLADQCNHPDVLLYYVDTHHSIEEIHYVEFHYLIY